LLNETEHAGQRVFDGAGAFFVNIAAHPDWVGHVAPTGRARFFEFAKQKSFLGALRKEHVNRFEMRAGHRENVRGALDQVSGQRLTAQVADGYAFAFANLNGIKTRRLPANGVHAGRRDFDVFAISDQPAEQPFRDRTAADIASANKEDTFHDWRRACQRANNLIRSRQLSILTWRICSHSMLTKETKVDVRGDYRRSWMSDDYFDLIVWYEPSNAIYGFQLCYDKPASEWALTWMKERGFIHAKIDSGEDSPEANRTPILLPGGSFPATRVGQEFRRRSEGLPKSLRNFVLAKLKQFAAKQKA
jgi:hypothetical protein